MGYLNNISSFEVMSSAQVAIELCQCDSFKEIALRLEKPTYGAFIPYERSPFVSDPEKLSIWATMERNDRSLNSFERSCAISDLDKVMLWDEAVDEQCQRLTESLPRHVRKGVHAWIKRIALEYLSYSRRQEVLFKVSRYFLMNIFTIEDWTKAARLDEKKLAQRLIEDERLTVLQRYRIACVYCLQVHIPQLWRRLSQEERRLATGKDTHPLSEETNYLVILWSFCMSRDSAMEVALQRNSIWTWIARKAVLYGNHATLVSIWERMQEHKRQEIIIDMALQSVQHWQSIKNNSQRYGSYKKSFVSDDLLSVEFPDFVKYLNLPSYYSRLMLFFLLRMDEQQKLTFFKKAFQKTSCNSVLECFLDWPHQNDFLPTIDQLWAIIPKDRYGQCLLTLVDKYSGCDEEENHYYDYQSLLGTLWENTPEEFKQSVFRDKQPESLGYKVVNEGKILLPRLLERSPFLNEDETIFKLIFCNQPQEERRTMMRSKGGEYICWLLAQKEMWSFGKWLLEECLPEEEIPSFKKQFIQSKCAISLCYFKLRNNHESWVEGLIKWSLKLDTEKTQFKDELIMKRESLDVCDSLLRKGEFAKVESMINFCVPSDQREEQFKVRFAEHTCGTLLKTCVWEQMDTILAWSVNVKEKIIDLKKNIFSSRGIASHYEIVFIQRRWEEVERFYQWFDLSLEEITKLKKDTLFTVEVIKDIHKELPEYTKTLVASLRWCLTDEEMVIELKKEVEKYFLNYVLNERVKKEKERLEDLVRELLYYFREEVQDKTNRKSTLGEDKGEKRPSAMIEDEPSSPRKRGKSDK